MLHCAVSWQLSICAMSKLKPYFPMVLALVMSEDLKIVLIELEMFSNVIEELVVLNCSNVRRSDNCNMNLFAQLFYCDSLLHDLRL